LPSFAVERRCAALLTPHLSHSAVAVHAMSLNPHRLHSLIRQQAALARINHLKSANLAHERNLALHSSALSAQHELLHDVTVRCASLLTMLSAPQQHPPPPQQQQWAATSAKDGSPSYEVVYASVLQLHQRLQRGAQPQASSSTQRPATPEHRR
jgi:hypothetical protein